jgi:hypothetical protein
VNRGAGFWFGQAWRHTVCREEKDDAMKISIDLTREQATALLTFLRRIEKEAERTTLDPSEVKLYVEASERLRVALRDVVEPSWRK